jgi:hypothetical protein
MYFCHKQLIMAISITNIENTNSAFCDIILLGAELPIDLVCSQLSNFSNHFEDLSLGKMTLSKADMHLCGSIVEDWKKRGAMVIWLKEVDGICQNEEENIILTNKINSDNINAAHWGYQRILCSPDDIYRLEANSGQSLSLGMLSLHNHLVEPLMRRVENLCIDLNVCSAYTVPNVHDAIVTGMDINQLISCAKYAGSSENLKSVSFNVSNIEFQEGKTPEIEIMSQCIWYLVESYSNRTSIDFENAEMHYIQNEDLEEGLQFAYVEKTNQWWVKLHEDDYDFIPCSETEYNETKDGHTPQRLLDALTQITH